MSDLTDLYQELIIDHNKHPRNRRKPEGAHRRAEGYNPLCGDRVTVYVKVANEAIQDVCFEGSGCAISTASASLMTESLKGKTLGEARSLFERFHKMVTEAPKASTDVAGGLGKLEVFSGVQKYPARVKCATLVWHTVNAALENKGETVCTE